MKIFDDMYKRRVIYIFEVNDEAHRGLLKIGETTADISEKNLCDAADARAKQIGNILGVKPKVRYAAAAVRNDGSDFRDHDVHRMLKKYKHTFKDATAREWFKVSLPTAVTAIDAVKRGRQNLSGMNTDEIFPEIILRAEQNEAVERTVEYFKRDGKFFLWNAKMRFGKTLCAIELVRRMNFSKTIILTHRPVTDTGWYEDFNKIFRPPTNFIYFNKGGKIKGVKQNLVYFVSMQDLRGSESVGGRFDKNDEIFKTAWDFVIVDEAHEGTQTELGNAVIKKLVKKNTKVLELSGTPFNRLEDFSDENTFTWSYVDEQRAKEIYDAAGDFNPYADLPAMKIFTYNLAERFKFGGLSEMSFNFTEFFRVEGKNFLHEADVKNFLDLLTSAENYPFSRAEFRKNFRHTFWILPGVAEAKALKELLQAHKIFSGFEVVNVAGSEEVNPNQTLQKVRAVIAENDYSITLSCGKLTTGVTVPEWTAVFYLAGGSSTSATSYLQTIFRVQSPCNKNGFVKKNCYVFDFAPDRTLRIMTDYAKVSARPGKATDVDRFRLGELLNFCPVIACEKSEMKPFSPDKIFTRLKRAYAERVVRNGFADNYIYNDKLLNLDELELEKFKNLRGIMGASKAQQKMNEIEINAQGFDDEEREKISKDKKNLSPEEKDRLRRRKNRLDAISILRGISIRMPLLIYGADVPFDEDIKIEDFDKIIDDASWLEFMPAGVTKKFFRDFIQYYDRDIFIEAGRKIRRLAKDADALPPLKRIQKIAELFDTFKNPDKETVLTPWRVVQLHLDAAFDQKFFQADKKILEINSKTGLYPLYVTQKIFSAQNSDALDVWDKIVAENVFVICKTPMAKKITRRTLVGFRGSPVNAKFFPDLIDTLKNNLAHFLGQIITEKFWCKGVGKMFFDAVVGNPPYQNITANTSDEPVYNFFIDAAFKIADKVSLIHPARCLFNAGKTKKEFNQRLLANEHFKIVKYFPKSQEIFPTSDIKGGVVITLYDANENFGAIGTFITFEELISIHQKVCVENKNFSPLSEIIYPPESFHFTKKFHEENPNAAKFLSDGHADDLTTNIFEKLPKIFFDDKPNDEHEYIQILGLVKTQRIYKWIRRDFVRNETNLDKYKIIVPKSNGSGAIGEVLSTPLVGLPLVGCTQTFITVGAFDTRAEADACLKYIKSKFARAMLGILKVTQHNPPATWAKVPLQDFTAGSDIDWRGDVDEQLYDKYKLSAAERNFIEERVKAMT